jgi:hypothetical protein
MEINPKQSLSNCYLMALKNSIVVAVIIHNKKMVFYLALLEILEILEICYNDGCPITVFKNHPKMCASTLHSNKI